MGDVVGISINGHNYSSVIYTCDTDTDNTRDVYKFYNRYF